jgi:exo-beta-1,3-glucanase (GH17 family)
MTCRMKGVNYDPFRDGQRPGGPCPTLADIEQDMRILRQIAYVLRTYGLLDCTLGEKFMAAAQRTQVKLILGLWISHDHNANVAEIRELKRLAPQALHHVHSVVVGSEVLLRDDATIDNLIAYIEQVKAIVPGVPVTTAEPWHIWAGLDDRYPNLWPVVKAVDFILANIHPYWDGVCIDQAVDTVFERLSRIQDIFPTTSIVVSETGWPTNGEMNACAVPSLDNQRLFLQEFLCRAQMGELMYFIFAAADTGWQTNEGLEVEAHWGILNADRTPKQSFKLLFCCPLSCGGRVVE